MITGAALGLVVLVALYVIYIYNRLITLRNLSQEGWSGIGVQLKQRANLIPNLIESVKGYMGHERGALENVTTLRTQCIAAGNIQERSENENMLTEALRQLFAVAENYILIQSFPSNIVAKQFSFVPASFFEIDDLKEREVPTVKFP